MLLSVIKIFYILFLYSVYSPSFLIENIVCDKDLIILKDKNGEDITNKVNADDINNFIEQNAIYKCCKTHITYDLRLFSIEGSLNVQNGIRKEFLVNDSVVIEHKEAIEQWKKIAALMKFYLSRKAKANNFMNANSSEYSYEESFNSENLDDDTSNFEDEEDAESDDSEQFQNKYFNYPQKDVDQDKTVMTLKTDLNLQNQTLLKMKQADDKRYDSVFSLEDLKKRFITQTSSVTARSIEKNETVQYPATVSDVLSNKVNKDIY